MNKVSEYLWTVIKITYLGYHCLLISWLNLQICLKALSRDVKVLKEILFEELNEAV